LVRAAPSDTIGAMRPFAVRRKARRALGSAVVVLGVLGLFAPGAQAWSQVAPAAQGAATEGPAPEAPGGEAPAAEPGPAAAPEAGGAQPQPAYPQAPPSTRATFLSTSGEPWNVAIDGQALCATPCTLDLNPVQFATLQSQELRPVLLDVGRLPPGQFTVSGKPLENGLYAGGIVATTLAGMALATGITLTAVGLARDRDGMALAGGITGLAGAVMLPVGIVMMLRAAPSLTIAPAPL
jgi:hypothetical protein